MAILEVGKEKTFGTVGAAVKASKSGDEIRIYSGSYEDVFDCTKKLTFTGVPSDMNDFSTYPVIDGKVDSATAVLKECKFTNLIFSGDYTKKLEVINCIKNQNQLKARDKEELSKSKNPYQNPWCIGIESSCEFENCIFYGSKKLGAGIHLKKEGQKVVFKKCGFYCNSDKAIFINSDLDNTRVILDECELSYGDFAIEIEGKATVSMNKTTITNMKEQAITAGDKSHLLINECKISECETGIILVEESKMVVVETEICWNLTYGIVFADKSETSIYDSKVTNNFGPALTIHDESKVTVYGSEISDNQDYAAGLDGQSNLSIYDSKIHDNAEGINSGEITKVYVRKSMLADNKNQEVFLRDKAQCYCEKTCFHNELKSIPEDDTPIVSIILADESEAVFTECDFSSVIRNETKLAMTADTSKILLKNCTLHEAEDGIGIFDNSMCFVEGCKFENINNLEIRMNGEKDSKLRVCDTELNEKTMEQFKAA